MDIIKKMIRHIEFISFSSQDDEETAKASGLRGLPFEMVSEIVSQLPRASDFTNLRLTCKKLVNASRFEFLKEIVDGRTIYPRYESFQDYFSLLHVHDYLPMHVHTIVLVSEGLKMHQYGYEWAWEEMQDEDNIEFDHDDMFTIDAVNDEHARDLFFNDDFITSGTYCLFLGLLLKFLPNLRTIKVRKLRRGEHNPYWSGPKLLKDLSFYTPQLNTNKIFYGDWQYDTKHKRVTIHVDEFGDQVQEPDIGPQASFREDFEAAMAFSGTKAKVEEIA